MKKTFLIFAVVLTALYVSCTSSGGSKEPAPKQTVSQSTAPAVQPAQRQTTPPSPAVQPAPKQTTPPPAPAPVIPASLYYSGDGGKGKSLAILAPKAAGLVQDQVYIPALVQGEFVSNFSGYSALSVMDRENLDKVYGELLSGYYSDDDKAGLDLGHLSATDYLLNGTITKTTTGYALQIQITKTDDKMIAASYSGTCTFAELDNLSGIRRASLELLAKMGVTPTEKTRTELAGAAETNHVNAQTTLAQGITAQQGGTVVEALSYYIQSAGYDPGLAEAASRMNILSANIRSGNIGSDVRNDIQWRRDWVARLQEAETFFANYTKQAPPYYLVYDADIKQGTVNYQNETVSLSGIRIAAMPDLEWFRPIKSVIATVRAGLYATNRTGTWGLDWPAKSVGSPSPFTDQAKTWAVVVEIVNSDRVSIGRQTVRLPYGWIFDITTITPVVTLYQNLTFPAVNANLITDRLTVRISSIDGVSAENAARQRQISILPATDYRQIPSVQKNALYPDCLKMGNIYYSYPHNSQDLQIAYGASIIGKRAFGQTYSRAPLRSVTIPDSVITIDDDAFLENILTSVTIPNSVTTIGASAFNGNKLTSITIGANVNYLGNSNGANVNYLGHSNAGFFMYYNAQGKRAGTYILRNGKWSRQ